MKKTQHTESSSASTRSATSASGFRKYQANSPEAKARLIALALLADGRLDDQELIELARRNAFARLGLSRDDFFQVLYDFCADVSTTPNRGDSYLLAPGTLENMFAEVTEAAERKALLNVIFDVIRSDGRLALGEARLFWNAVDAWQLPPAGSPSGLRSRKLRSQRSAPALAIA